MYGTLQNKQLENARIVIIFMWHWQQCIPFENNTSC